MSGGHITLDTQQAGQVVAARAGAQDAAGLVPSSLHKGVILSSPSFIFPEYFLQHNPYTMLKQSYLSYLK
jgi:hypothetical protein